MAGMLIAGERPKGAAGEGIDVVDPATEETIETVPRGTAADVDAAVQAAAQGLRASGQKTDAEDRANLLRKAIALIERDRKDLTMSPRARAGQAGDRGRRRDPPPDPRPELLRRPRDQGRAAPTSALPSALSKAYGMVMRRPMGVVAAIVPEQLPAHAARHQARAGADGGQHDRGQARGHDAADDAQDRRPAARGRVPARRGQRDHRHAAPRSATRSSPTTRSAASPSPAPPPSAATSWAWPRRS